MRLKFPLTRMKVGYCYILPYLLRKLRMIRVVWSLTKITKNTQAVLIALITVE